jgi:hypothetical protein
MTNTTYTCAAWYTDDYGQATYELAQTEEQAAQAAAWADGYWEVLGLQWASGETVPADQWQAFSEAKRRLRQAEQNRRANPAPPPPTRRTYDPFRGHDINIETAEPDWLGDPTNRR